MVFHDVTYSPIDNTCLFLLAGLASGLLLESNQRAAVQAGERRIVDVRPAPTCEPATTEA